MEHLKQNLDQAVISVMELSTEGIFIEDTEGNILLCNQAGAEMFGYSQEELQALHVSALRPASDATIPSSWHDADGNPDVLVENCRLRRDGSLFPVEVNSRRSTTLAIRWMVGFARKRKERTMIERLAGEILDASNGVGASVKKREDVFKMAESNRAFSHYRW